MRRLIPSLVATVALAVPLLTATTMAAVHADTLPAAPVTLSFDPNSHGGTAIEVEHRAPSYANNDEDSWDFTGKVWITNNSDQEIHLLQVTVQGPAVDNWSGPNVGIIAAHQTVYTRFFAYGDFPTDGTFLRLYFKDYANLDTPLTLVDFKSDVPGGYVMPFKAEETPADQVWMDGDGRGPSSHHWADWAQQYANDVARVRWNYADDVWTPLKVGTNGTKVTDYLGYGQRIYATASGTIMECRYSRPTQTPKTKTQTGTTDSDHRFGNGLWIKTGDHEYTAYAHMQPNSIPAELCPQQSVSGPDRVFGIPIHAKPIHVQAGQFLGLLGNTGNTTGPHLHIQLTQNRPFDMDDSDGSSQPGLPLMFRKFKSGDEKHHAYGYVPLTWWPVGDNQVRGFPEQGIFMPNSPCPFVPVAAGAEEWSVTGVSNNCLASTISDLKYQGLLPTQVDGARIGQQTVFDVVAKADQPETRVLAGLTPDDFKAYDAAQTIAGLTLTDLDSYLIGSEVRMAGVWKRLVDHDETTYYANLSASENTTKLNQLVAAGWVPDVVAPVGTANGTRYSALLTRLYAGTVRVDVGAVSTYQTTFNQRVAAHLVPTSLETFNATSPTGTPMVAVVWSTYGNSDYLFKTGMSPAQWVTQQSTQTRNGFGVGSLSTYQNGTGTLIASLWQGHRG